jgi:hypothetical protein
MIESTRKLTAIKYAATLVGALAVVVLAPATAQALPVNNNEGGGCHYTDKDGYDIPIDEGQDVFVDGKIVSVAVERSSSPLRQRALAGEQSRLICRRKSTSRVFRDSRK